MANGGSEPLDLKAQLSNTLEGARMILPGIQALFGFQLIAVFQPAFTERLTDAEKLVHLTATGLSAIAAAFTIAPAALHRRAEPDQASSFLIGLSNAFLATAMWPLAFAIFLDFALILEMITHQVTLAWSIAGFILFTYLCLWVALPKLLASRLEQAKQIKRTLNQS